ncbi:hypothetical protein EJB05_27887 [Eragrostis curvula]|uniref:ABC transporter domain-containing protein n=1 Tax=Eragrostis curvula TaxID=38414 RepID=A0A5J9UNP4_9POAL|nr:hypothetical protein EJB05_27887 [Eragrostis curvula]
MLAAAVAVAFPPAASSFFPVKPAASFGLIFGRSGSGKTTLLQLLAGLSQPTSGSICIQKYNDNGKPSGLPELLTSERVGIVFQFPERYFLADTVLEEVTFGWPRQKVDLIFKEQLAFNLQNAFNSVGLRTISLDEDPQSLSGGFKRRLALAIQLVQTPDLLLLDEPLAGLDWKARADVVNLLRDLKKHHTILVVSHDLSKKQTASNDADKTFIMYDYTILQGVVSTSGSLVENGNGRKFEGGSFVSVKMHLLV